jgi:lysyl-tRNA synthetase class II
MAEDENRLIAERRAKLKALRGQGVAYPNDFPRQDFAAPLVEKYRNVEREALDRDPVAVRVAGRLRLKRTMGKITFAHIQDESGQIQIFVADNAPDKETHDAFKHYDIGDIVGVEGRADENPHGRGNGAGRRAAPPRQVAAAAAGESFTASPTRSCATGSATSTSS